MFSRRAQTALEFLLLVAAAFLIFIVFTYSTREEFIKAQTAKEYSLVKDLAFSLQSEVNRASVIEDGYRHTFKLPETLEGHYYNTTIRNNTLLVNSRNYDFSVAIYPVLGNFTIGANTIRKSDGIVYINS